MVNTANQCPITVDPPPIPVTPPAQQSPRTSVLNTPIPWVRFVPIKGGLQNQSIISQEAIHFLTKCVWAKSPNLYTPNWLKPTAPPTAEFDFQQVGMPMVHPTTSETISSYKKLMHDPATAEMWQTAFGKYFGGMVQGHMKTGQKGMNLIFVMAHAEITKIPKNQTVTYAQVVVNFRPQKADQYCIRITTGGNLINYPGKLSTCTADLTTSKLMWNNVLSTKGAKYVS
jgi:hypothetical protein